MTLSERIARHRAQVSGEGTATDTRPSRDTCDLYRRVYDRPPCEHAHYGDPLPTVSPFVRRALARQLPAKEVRS